MICEWNKLVFKIQSSTTLEKPKKHLLSFIRPVSNTIYSMYNPFWLQLLTHIRVGFSHLKVHKFKHKFQDTV